MSVPVLMLATPFLAALLVYVLQRWRWAQAIIAAVVCALLALLALQIPLDQVAVFAGRDITFQGTWSVLGRAFTFAPENRPALAFIYIASMFFFAGAGAAKVPSAFLPAGLLSVSLLTATLFVQPFLFAALFLEMLAAVSVLMLSDDDHPFTRGSLRLLVFVTLGVPFILLAGWQIEGATSSPDDLTFLTRATVLLDIGLLILLAILPFHSWIPTVAEESSPYAAAFVFTVVQMAVMFFMLNFFNQYAWLRSPTQFAALRFAGVAMVIGGGAFAFAQRRFGRLMGYAVMVDIGAAMLAVGLGTADGLRAALAIIAMRGIGLSVWGMGLGWLRASAKDSTDFDDLVGKAWQFPFASIAVVIGGLSLAGLPLTAGFVGRWALYRQLAVSDYGFAIALLAASGSVMLAYARGAASLFKRTSTDKAFSIQDDQVAVVFLAIGVAVILFVGLFPQMVLPAVTQAAGAFKALVK